jgi:hypothetical protein
MQAFQVHHIQKQRMQNKLSLIYYVFFFLQIFINNEFIRSKPSWRIEAKQKQPCEPQSYSSDRACLLVQE